MNATNTNCPAQNALKSVGLSKTRMAIIVVLFAVWLVPTTFLLTVKEKLIDYHLIAIEGDVNNGK